MVVILLEWELQAYKTGFNFQFLPLRVQHFHPLVRRTIWYSAERVLAGLL